MQRAQRNASDDFLYEIKPVKCEGPSETEGEHFSAGLVTHTHAVRRRKTNDHQRPMQQTTTGNNNNYGILPESWKDQIFKKF